MITLMMDAHAREVLANAIGKAVVRSFETGFTQWVMRMDKHNFYVTDSQLTSSDKGTEYAKVIPSASCDGGGATVVSKRMLHG